MKRNDPMALLAATCVGAALTLGAGAFAHDPKPATGAHTMTGQSTSSMELHRIMTTGQKMPMSGDVDKDFAMMMSMHHQMAIDMVDVLLKYGSNAELKAMAAKMRAAQTEEINAAADIGVFFV